MERPLIGALTVPDSKEKTESAAETWKSPFRKKREPIGKPIPFEPEAAMVP